MGLTQKEMAEIAECSRPTIQAIELGKLKLSGELAQRIHFKTGVLLEWLLENQVTVPPLGDDLKPYTEAAFAERQAALLSPVRTGDDACLALWDVWTLFARHVKLLSILYAEAYKRDKVGIVAYKSAASIAEIIKHTLKQPEAVAARYEPGSDEPVSPKRLDEVAQITRDFATETYAELKRRMSQRKGPLSAEVKQFLSTTENRIRRKAKR
ncbi:MAG: helix-turn-helix transcriptional regulator [Verrucomicrobiota bacterium]